MVAVVSLLRVLARIYSKTRYDYEYEIFSILSIVLEVLSYCDRGRVVRSWVKLTQG